MLLPVACADLWLTGVVNAEIVFKREAAAETAFQEDALGRESAVFGVIGQ